MAGEARVRRLRWMCRRGMKELDVLLESFLEANHSRLGDGEWPEFEQLLESEDDRLWDLLRGAEASADPSFEAVIKAIGDACISGSVSRGR